MNIKLDGFTVSRGADFARGFTILGYGEVTIPDLGMTLRGCALAYIHGEVVALPPRLSEDGTASLRAVIWGNHAPISQAICKELVDGYYKMGGAPIPPATPAQTTARAAARRVAAKGTEEEGLRRVLRAD